MNRCSRGLVLAQKGAKLKLLTVRKGGVASLSNRTCCSAGDGKECGDRRLRPFLLDNPLRRFLSPPEKLLEGHAKAGMLVADLGCGPGYITLPAAEMVGESGRVHAIDFDEKHITEVQKKAERKGLGNIEARVSSAASVHFIPSESVDLIIANGLLCCMVDHEGSLKEIHRIMKPGGEAYLSVTRFGRRRDRMHVAKEEWESILAQFSVKARGEKITGRWAWVQRP